MGNTVGADPGQVELVGTRNLWGKNNSAAALYGVNLPTPSGMGTEH